MPRTKQHNHMATVTGKRPEAEAEWKAREAYEEAEAAWLAASRIQDGFRAAEVSLQKIGLHKLWKEESAKAKAAWSARLRGGDCRGC